MTERAIPRFVGEEHRVQVVYKDRSFNGQEMEAHWSCAAVDSVTCERKMLLFRFDEAMSNERVIGAMRELGCRPATHHELLALAQSSPELFAESEVIALGSYFIQRYVGPTYATLRTTGGAIQNGWVDDDVSPPGTFFLGVRLPEEVVHAEQLQTATHQLATRLMDLAHAKNLPTSVLQRLLTDEGQETLDAMLVMAHADSLSEQPARPVTASAAPTAKFVLRDDEYLVHVDYTRVLTKAALEPEFSGPGSLYSFRDGRLIRHHESGRVIDETVTCRVMLVKHFDRRIGSKTVIKTMLAEGYRPAREDELFAFARAYPELQRKFWIVALGTCYRDREDGAEHVSLLRVGQDGRRILTGEWIGVTWDAPFRFLCIRNDVRQPLSP